MVEKLPDQTVEAENTYDKIHQKTWLRRTAGFLAGATMGATYGALIGVVAAFLPAIFGAIGIAGAAVVGVPTLAAVAASAGLFAAVGVGIGLPIGADVAVNSASVAAGLEEQQKRNMKGKGTSSPDTDTTKSESKPTAMYTLKAAPVVIPLFAVFGALLALSPITSPVVALLGFKGAVAATATAIAQPASTAAIAASASVFSMFGALMPIRNSLIHNKLTNFYTELLTSKKADNAQAIQPERTPAKIVNEQASAPSVERPTRSFSTNERRYSLENILSKTEDHSAALTR